MFAVELPPWLGPPVYRDIAVPSAYAGDDGADMIRQVCQMDTLACTSGDVIDAAGTGTGLTGLTGVNVASTATVTFSSSHPDFVSTMPQCRVGEYVVHSFGQWGCWRPVR